tara:strand:+ start:496 stop:903 length:408 start_codon:yes stop_codon:yes gene_type:complete
MISRTLSKTDGKKKRSVHKKRRRSVGRPRKQKRSIQKQKRRSVGRPKKQNRRSVGRPKKQRFSRKKRSYRKILRGGTKEKRDEGKVTKTLAEAGTLGELFDEVNVEKFTKAAADAAPAADAAAVTVPDSKRSSFR